MSNCNWTFKLALGSVVALSISVFKIMSSFDLTVTLGKLNNKA